MGSSHTINELVDALSSLLGTAIVPQYPPARVGEARASLADISLAREELGHVPAIDFETGLGRTIAWFREHRHNQESVAEVIGYT